jgi:hypothetical protein
MVFAPAAKSVNPRKPHDQGNDKKDDGPFEYLFFLFLMSVVPIG